ncbi:hypothetical protein [Nocardioides sp. NPDC006273]|uniref:hypothetical protein n=1 Tax=Nocardioides sp. NPDC006273 TaxID=3155598 RepID=UPI0033B8D92A
MKELGMFTWILIIAGVVLVVSAAWSVFKPRKGVIDERTARSNLGKTIGKAEYHGR